MPRCLARRATADCGFLPYSFSFSSWPSVRLCFSVVFAFFLESSTICPGRGSPILSRASSFTAVTARKVFFFFALVMLRKSISAFAFR